MKNKPSVSVLMSVHNGGQFLRQAIDSILAQTYADFEFIIIEDGPSGKVIAILDTYTDSRIIRLTNDVNLGLTKSLNRGLKIARGDYIARQDDDDISYSTRLEKQVNKLREDPTLAAVFTAYDVITETGKTIETSHPPTGSQEIRESLFYSNPLQHSNATLRRHELQAIGGYDEEFRVAQDYELWLRMSNKFKIYCLPEVLAAFRVYPTSTSTGMNRSEQRRNILRARKTAFSQCEARGLSARTVALYYFTVALYEIMEGRVQQGAQNMQAALRAGTDLENETELLLSYAVNLAVELGPSGRALIRVSEDVEAGRSFLNAVSASIPSGMLRRFKRDLFAEFYAACAYLFGTRGKRFEAAVNLLRSFRYSTRHVRNLGLIKLLFVSAP